MTSGSGLITRGVGRNIVALVGLISLPSACGPAHATDPDDVASLKLTCTPDPHGVHCRLLALFRDVSRQPSDVTSDASWHVRGVRGAQISPDGVISAPTDGDLSVDAQYRSHQVQAWARLTTNGPGFMLAVLRGRVYLEHDGALRPLAAARVEVVGGPSAGLTTMTAADGSYELVGFIPDQVVVLRATKTGCTAAEGSTQVFLGVNRLSLLIEALPPTRASAL